MQALTSLTNKLLFVSDLVGHSAPAKKVVANVSGAHRVKLEGLQNAAISTSFDKCRISGGIGRLGTSFISGPTEARNGANGGAVVRRSGLDLCTRDCTACFPQEGS